MVLRLYGTVDDDCWYFFCRFDILDDAMLGRVILRRMLKLRMELTVIRVLSKINLSGGLTVVGMS